MKETLLLLLMFCLGLGVGCDRGEQTVAERRDEVEQLLKEAEAHTPPATLIELPEPDGWVRSERRSLPAADHGFTVAYDHPNGLTVTLYQFTRGLKDVPESLEHPRVVREMESAISGIRQAVELGYWKSAEIEDRGTVALGDSNQKAIWTKHRFTMEQGTVPSETYIWTHNNNFYKIRFTGRPGQSAEDQSELRQLLTAIGNACT